jgi:hypothetical protein
MDSSSTQAIQTSTASEPPNTITAGVKRWILMLAYLLAGVFFFVRGLSVSSPNAESQSLLAMTVSLRRGFYITGALVCLLLFVRTYRPSASRK